jgi:outer membrane lipoprotein-sorting protein
MMKPRTKGIVAAVTGTALGVAGLAVIALPAGADAAPKLPEITAEELVASVMKADPPAFSGEVAVQNDLGLPNLPGMELADFDSARIYHDGGERARLAVQDGNGEYTVVKGADEVWAYDSAENTATQFDVPTEAKDPKKVREHALEKAELGDPSTAATEIIKKLSETSTIDVDGTARVADRPAYELVLTPKPSERTVLREVKVAIDSATRLPLRLQVMTNGSPDPILSLGFEEFTVGAQPDRLFEFTAPAGAKIVKPDPAEHQKQAEEFVKEHGADAKAFGEGLKVVGDGWDTVVTGQVPAELLSGETGGENGVDPQQLLERFGKKVTGDFGTGYLISTKAGSGLITDDGRFAAGAVPVQVLEEALGQK